MAGLKLITYRLTLAEPKAKTVQNSTLHIYHYINKNKYLGIIFQALNNDQFEIGGVVAVRFDVGLPCAYCKSSKVE